MKLNYCIVSTLGEYVDCISKIAGTEESSSHNPTVLWFRGLSNIEHSLIPSLFRKETRVKRRAGDSGDYSSLHYAEDIRTQHYIAKNYHFFAKEPSSRAEWLEVMQHHGVNTRVLDWSESSIHALLFALEAFWDNQRFRVSDRDVCAPCVWVLKPSELNKRVFELLRKSEGLVKILIKELDFTEDEIKKFLKNIGDYPDLYNVSTETRHLDYILNLSEINNEIFRDRSRLKYLLINGDIMNPYYYLLSRVYSDGVILGDRKLPPFAMVHPYHSERIKAQKGVFTISPYYEEQPCDEALRKAGIQPDAMEHNTIAGECLYRIIIDAPQSVASELLANGMFDSWLYPELPIAANEIENRKIYN